MQVELIGYSAGEDSLFLVYEFAENGALSEHLHATSPKGNWCTFDTSLCFKVIGEILRENESFLKLLQPTNMRESR